MSNYFKYDVKRVLTISLLSFFVVFCVSCGGSGKNVKEHEQEHSQAYLQLETSYNALMLNCSELKTKFSNDELTLRDVQNTISNSRNATCTFDTKDLDSAEIAQCKDLQSKVVEAKTFIDDFLQVLPTAKFIIVQKEEEILKDTIREALYLHRDDRFYYNIDGENVTIRIYDVGTEKLLKSYVNKHYVNDSIKIKHKGIYYIEITGKGKQYVSYKLNTQYASMENILAVKQVSVKMVDGKKTDFKAVPYKVVKMTSLLDEPYKASFVVIARCFLRYLCNV